MSPENDIISGIVTFVVWFDQWLKLVGTSYHLPNATVIIFTKSNYKH